MLTIKSKLVNFKSRNGELYTAEELNSLYEALILPDIVTFPKNKTRNFGYGFTEAIANKVYEKLTLDKGTKILVINDISLQVYNKLTDEGYKKENIYLAFGKWNKNALPADDDSVYNVMKDYIKYNFADELNIIKLKEIFTMSVDGVIANPPYGAIGANITKKIIDTVDFKEYINLLPANDYKRNKDKDLFNYQSDMECVTRTNTTVSDKKFADAAVTTHVARIHKDKVNDLATDEFEISVYIDKSLNKYFIENLDRKSSEIDITLGGYDTHEYNITTSVLFGVRDINHKHLPYKKDTVTYRWNILEDIDYKWLVDNYWSPTVHFTGGIRYTAIEFKTEIEKDNFTSFIYSKDGFRFISKVFTAVNCDGAVNLGRVFPKVDWTRSWTVEEILADYGYTEDEIKAVMEDLKNFKGMDD